MILYTDLEDGSAKFTVVDDELHRFSASVNGDEVVVQYEETLSDRGDVVVAEPGEELYRKVIVSDEMTSFLEEHNASKVTYVRP